jgi:hypothetical protein
MGDVRNTSWNSSAARRLRTPAPTAALALPALLVAALAIAVPSAPAATGTGEPSGSTPAKPPMSVALEQCVSAVEQPERSATFSGEMSAIADTAKMQMRIDVLERVPSDAAYHTVSAAGLGVWRTAAPGVKTYKYLKQVTNLAAPAYYRAAIRFRWLTAKGKLIRATELRTPRCLQTAPPREEPGGAEAPLPPG